MPESARSAFTFVPIFFLFNSLQLQLHMNVEICSGRNSAILIQTASSATWNVTDYLGAHTQALWPAQGLWRILIACNHPKYAFCNPIWTGTQWKEELKEWFSLFWYQQGAEGTWSRVMVPSSLICIGWSWLWSISHLGWICCRRDLPCPPEGTAPNIWYLGQARWWGCFPLRIVWACR